jgi:malonate transporter
VTAILAFTGPIFALIALGWTVTRTGLLDPGTIRALGRYVVTLALPALIFRAVTARESEDLVDLPYLAAYLAGSLAVFGLAFALARRRGGAAATFRAMGSACSNTGFIGYPILLIALPTVADAALALNMIVENLVMIPLVLILAERGRAEGPALERILRRLSTNPIILGLVAGLAMAFSPFSVPAVLAQGVNLLAMSSAAISLVVIGGNLVDLPRTAVSGGVAAVVAGKLLAHPLAVAGAFALLGALGFSLDGELVAAGILLAAMPTMGVYPILAAQYGEGPPAAVAMLTMTVLSFFTLGAFLWTLR